MPASQVMLPPPDEEKPDMLFSEDEGEEAKPSTKEPISEKEIAEMWDGKKNTPSPAAKPAEKQQEAKPAEQVSPVVESSKAKRDPATIKNWGDLCDACRFDFKMSRADVLKELGVTDFKTLKGVGDQSPESCYVSITAVRGS